MGLRDVALKEEYRTDKDDIFTDFIVPCLTNCIEFKRCIEYVSLNAITTLALGFDNFMDHKAKLKIICGHRFGAFDLSLLSRIFSPSLELNLNQKQIQNTKIKILESMVNDSTLEIKIAIPNSEDIVGSFSENIGLFIDEKGDSVAFSGTTNETISGTKNFESLDVFTSWNDKSRVDSKLKDFDDLWENKTNFVSVYDFRDADKKNLLKYSTKWAIDT